jgi:hypothetical protein
MSLTIRIGMRKIGRHLLCLGFLLLFSLALEGQTRTPSPAPAPSTTHHAAPYKKPPRQKDVIDVLKKVFHRNILAGTDSIEHKKGELHISFIPAVAYTLITRTTVAVAANGAFYTDDDKNANLSLINTTLAYTQNHQIIFPFHTSIWTKGNKYNLLGDWRYYRYPQYTYGLGGQSSLKNADALNYSYLTLRETVQKKLSKDFYLGIGYNLDYHWDISEKGLGDVVTDYQKYGKSSRSISTGPSLKLLYDARRNPINPQGGSFATLVYRPNLKMLGSDQNWQYLLLEYRKYFVMPGPWHNILACWSYNWLTLDGKPPYLDLPSTAWDEYGNVGRGYIQSRFRGRNLLNWPGDKFETVWPGVGTGLRLKVNKHSNTNMAIDYGFGMDGSNGIFFGLGEVF